MNVVLKAAAVLFLGLLVVACSGNGDDGGNGAAVEEAAIQEMMDGFLNAFEDGDATSMASFFSRDCGDVEATAVDALDLIESFSEEIAFELTGVDVRNLKEDSAEVLPEGFVSVNGEAEPLAEEGDEYTRVVKEDGEWKIADCGFFQ